MRRIQMLDDLGRDNHIEETLRRNNQTRVIVNTKLKIRD